MKPIAKNFESLTTRELYEILKARAAVFVVEQDCVYQDLDDIDYIATHIFCQDENGKIAAYLRIFCDPDEPSLAHIGRVLTVRRGNGLGKVILRYALQYSREILKCDRAYCEAQTYAVGFYQKVGFAVTSGEFSVDGLPHVKMICNIQEAPYEH